MPVKVLFRLVRDEQGYPPADIEGIWTNVDGSDVYTIDNIPFFANGIAIGDKIEAVKRDEEYWFVRKLESSGHATIRLIFFQLNQIDTIRERLRTLGCSSELSHLPMLVSVDIPPSVDYDAVVWELIELEELEVCELEEACMPP